MYIIHHIHLHTSVYLFGRHFRAEYWQCYGKHYNCCCQFIILSDGWNLFAPQVETNERKETANTNKLTQTYKQTDTNESTLTHTRARAMQSEWNIEHTINAKIGQIINGPVLSVSLWLFCWATGEQRTRVMWLKASRKAAKRKRTKGKKWMKWIKIEVRRERTKRSNSNNCRNNSNKTRIILLIRRRTVIVTTIIVITTAATRIKTTDVLEKSKRSEWHTASPRKYTRVLKSLVVFVWIPHLPVTTTTTTTRPIALFDFLSICLFSIVFIIMLHSFFWCPASHSPVRPVRLISEWTSLCHSSRSSSQTSHIHILTLTFNFESTLNLTTTTMTHNTNGVQQMLWEKWFMHTSTSFIYMLMESLAASEFSARVRSEPF